MTSIKILKPEVINDPSECDTLILIRRIQFIRPYDADRCDAPILDLLDVYPSSLRDGIFQCRTTGKRTSAGFDALVQINADMIESIRSGYKDNDTILYQHIGKIITVPLWIPFSSIQPVDDTDTPILQQLSESNDINFKFKGDIELYVKFEYCSKSKRTTCYQIEHPKTWDLRARCIHGEIGCTI